MKKSLIMVIAACSILLTGCGTSIKATNFTENEQTTITSQPESAEEAVSVPDRTICCASTEEQIDYNSTDIVPGCCASDEPAACCAAE